MGFQMSDYKCCHVDADTILVRAANFVQEGYITVTNKHTNEVMEFSGVQKFWGKSTKKRDSGWIGEQEQYTADDFVVEKSVRLKPLPPTEESYLKWAMWQIDSKVGNIKKVGAKEYKLWIGGEGNFRYDVAQIQPYKKDRPDKPMLFKELREAFIKKYGKRVGIARDGIECDDEISMKGWESYWNFRKTGKHLYVLGYIDKDIDQVPCPSFNYDKPELGIVTPSIEDCCRSFCKQILTGDSIDSVPGLKGVGKETALKLLEGRNTPKEMYEAVVVAYKDYYGLEAFSFVSHRGVESTRTWLDMLKENAVLLYMLREPYEVYNIEETFKRLGVEYE